jgi:ketosteroid isomerase-like protein
MLKISCIILLACGLHACALRPADPGSPAAAEVVTAPAVKTGHQAIHEINACLARLGELERTLDPAIIEDYYPDKLVSLVNGRITRPSRKSLLNELAITKRTHEYRVVDLKKPVIGVSGDASMAWAAVQQRKLEIDSRSGATLRTWEYATLMVFTQTPAGDWELVSIARSDSGE